MSDSSEQQPGQSIDALSFEQAQAELERIVERLEDQHTGLDEAIALWERGEALHAYCQRKLDYAAQRLEKLQVTPDEAAAVVAEGGDDFASAPAAPSPADAAPAEAGPADVQPALSTDGGLEKPLF